MGLLDFLLNLLSGGSKLQCPGCGTIGARKTSSGQIRCKNPACPYFDPSLAPRGAGTTVPTEGSFQPVKPLTIRYRNFAGQERAFVFEWDSVVNKGNHLVGRVAPTGRKIVLARERIQNLGEVEAQLPQSARFDQPRPTPRENQVLGYHRKHGTTSPLFEKIRAKYPLK